MYYLNRVDRAKNAKDKNKKQENLDAAQKHLNNYNSLNAQIDALRMQRDSDIQTLDRLHQQLNALSSYKKGTISTLQDELAWTHQGEIIRRSDGAILRQLPAGTQVIPQAASENLLKWA